MNKGSEREADERNGLDMERWWEREKQNTKDVQRMGVENVLRRKGARDGWTGGKGRSQRGEGKAFGTVMWSLTFQSEDSVLF